MRFAPVKTLINADMTTTQHSIGLDVNQIALGSIQAVWTGVPVGTLFLEISNDDVPVAAAPNQPVGADPAANVVNWSTYTGSQLAISGPGNFLWNLVFLGYRWIRLSYTPTSGSGTLNSTASVKG